MGTNYYLESKEPCPCCGREYDRLHIGKSSAGWCFGLHVIPEQGINSLEDWKKAWEGKKIFDEYGKEISHEEMLKIIIARSWRGECEKHGALAPFGYKSWNDFHLSNNSEPGPEGLVRARIDGRHCIGHGDGTWDLITGEFS